MKIYKSARTSAFFMMALMMVAIFMGCTKKKERVYELLPPDPETEKDLTELAIKLNVSIENTGGPTAGEGSKKLIDNDLNSKFLIFSYAPSFTIELEYDIAERLDAYTMTTGGDAEGRDPGNWKLQASNDRATWTDLDTQTGYLFTARTQTKRFEFTNANKYKYYRLAITSLRAGGTSGLFQLAEWRVIRRPQ